MASSSLRWQNSFIDGRPSAASATMSRPNSFCKVPSISSFKAIASAAPQPDRECQGSMAIVEIEHLAKHFTSGGRRVEVLRDLDLSVNEGEFVTVVGPSGCGKSTMLHMLGGFIPGDAG